MLFRRNPKNRVRQVHWIFQNPPRKTQSHQNSDFLGKDIIHQILAVLGKLNIIILTFYGQGTPRDTVYPWGEGAHEQKSEHCRLRRVDNLHNNKYNILNSQAMRNKSSAGCHQERKPFGCKVFWINAGSAVLSLTGGNARACAQTLLRYP